MTDQFVESALKDIAVQLRRLQSPSAWEYRLAAAPLSLPDGIEASQRAFNAAGAEGWEVVGLTMNKWGSTDCLVVMKRPKRASTS